MQPHYNIIYIYLLFLAEVSKQTQPLQNHYNGFLTFNSFSVPKQVNYLSHCVSLTNPSSVVCAYHFFHTTAVAA